MFCELVEVGLRVKRGSKFGFGGGLGAGCGGSEYKRATCGAVGEDCVDPELSLQCKAMQSFLSSSGGYSLVADGEAGFGK